MTALVGVVLLGVFAAAAQAHQPSYSQGEHGSPETAWPVTDIDLSIVLYHPVVCEAPHLWLGFRADEPRDIFYQLGVPMIDRLSDYRPSVALLAPGLPEITESLPFEVPEGLGGIITHTGGVETPDEFFEPFTQTSSWILEETTEALPEAGVGYLVAWHPEGQTGKLWVAVGTVEDFSDIDIDESEHWFDNTQHFHEVGDFEPDLPVEELACPAPEPDVVSEPEEVEAGPESDADGESSAAPAGCQGAHRGPVGRWWLAWTVGCGALLVSRRRRDCHVSRGP